MAIINKLIEAIENATNLQMKPFDTDKVEDCLVYQFYTMSDNGAVAQYKLQIRIITNSLEKAFSIEKTIKNTMISIGDNIKIEGINSIILNGGGTLKDYENDTVQNILYFVITAKSEVN